MMSNRTIIFINIGISLSLIFWGVIAYCFFFENDFYQKKLSLYQKNLKCTNEYKKLDEQGIFITKDMHYTDAECKKLGGEAVQADTYASATQLYPKDPIRKSYLCGEKGILLGTINQWDVLGFMCCKYRKDSSEWEVLTWDKLNK